MDLNSVAGLVIGSILFVGMFAWALIGFGVAYHSQKQFELLEKKDELEKLSFERKKRYEADIAYFKLIDSLQNRTNNKRKK